MPESKLRIIEGRHNAKYLVLGDGAKAMSDIAVASVERYIDMRFGYDEVLCGLCKWIITDLVCPEQSRLVEMERDCEDCFEGITQWLYEGCRQMVDIHMMLLFASKIFFACGVTEVCVNIDTFISMMFDYVEELKKV